MTIVIAQQITPAWWVMLCAATVGIVICLWFSCGRDRTYLPNGLPGPSVPRRHPGLENFGDNILVKETNRLNQEKEALR